MPCPSQSTGLILPPEHSNNQSSQQQDGERTADPHHAHHDRSIVSSFRIVVIAIQHQLVHHSSNLVLRSLNQSETQILRRIFDPVVVLRKTSLRGSDYDSTSMRILLRPLVIDIAKTDCFG